MASTNASTKTAGTTSPKKRTLKPTLECEVDGVHFPHGAFVIASGDLTDNFTNSSKALARDIPIVIKTVGPEPTRRLKNAYYKQRHEGEGSRKGALERYVNVTPISDHPRAQWLEELPILRERFPEGIIIGSFLGPLEYASFMSHVEPFFQLGVLDAAEFNHGCPMSVIEHGMGMAIGQDRGALCQMTGWTVELMNKYGIPVSGKLTPNVGDIAAMAEAVYASGGKAVSLINTLGVIADIDIYEMVVQPVIPGTDVSVYGGESYGAVAGVARKMIREVAKLRAGNPAYANRSIWGMGGVKTWEDVVKLILLGADMVQIYTVLTEKGLKFFEDLRQHVLGWMKLKGFRRIEDFRGLMVQKIVTYEEGLRLEDLQDERVN